MTVLFFLLFILQQSIIFMVSTKQNAHSRNPTTSSKIYTDTNNNTHYSIHPIYIQFNMEIHLKQIQNFIASPNCLFQLQPLDYPSIWQQQLILSYFNMQQILQKSHQNIIKDLHSPYAKQLEQISQGFMYLLLLDRASIEQRQKYIIALRSQNWKVMAQNFFVLLCQCGDIIKPKYQLNIITVFNLLLQFNSCTPALIQIMTNFMTYYDMSPEAQSLTNAILLNFIKKIEQDNNQFNEFVPFTCHYLVVKSIRLSGYLFKDVCIKLISTIWNKFPEKCVPARNSILYALQSQGVNLKIQPFSSMYNTLKQNKQGIKDNSSLNLEIQYSFLSMRVRNVLDCLLKQTNVGPLQIRSHLSWLQVSWQHDKLNQVQIMADMAKWVSSMADQSERRVIILDDLCRKALKISSDALFKLMRSIFYNWFTQTEENFKPVVTSVLLLGHLSAAHMKIFVQMLAYIFKRLATHENRIRYIIKEGVKFNFLNIERIINNRFVPESLQQSFISLIEQPKPIQPHTLPQLLTQAQSQFYKYSAESPIKSDEGDGPNYDQELVSQLSIHNNDQAYEIMIEQSFTTQFENQLKNMLSEPNYENFVNFFKKVSKIIAQARIDNKQFVPTLLQQAAKTIYAAYNSEFEDIKNAVEPQKSVICCMSSMLLKQWYQVTNRVQAVKSLVKKLCQLFPTAEVAFWYYFIMQTDCGASSSRDFKNWMIPKDKTDYVIRAVQALLGQIDHNFRKKAFKFGIK